MSALLFVLGLGGVAFGGLEFMAGAMSDDPEAGDSAGKMGCLIVVAGVLCIAGGIALWWFR